MDGDEVRTKKTGNNHIPQRPPRTYVLARPGIGRVGLTVMETPLQNFATDRRYAYRITCEGSSVFIAHLFDQGLKTS